MSATAPPAIIKTISITGGAAEDFQKGKSTRRRRNSRKSNQGETMTPDTSVTLVPVEKPSLLQVAPPPPSTPAPQVQKPVPAPTSTKLVLAPPKKRETRLLLKGPKVSTATSGGASSSQSHTRKNVRKITLGLRSLTLKINKAKRIHKKVEEMKKDEVKALLLEKGLLKKDKKDPPESLMRQMYSDYLLITTKGM